MYIVHENKNKPIGVPKPRGLKKENDEGIVKSRI